MSMEDENKEIEIKEQKEDVIDSKDELTAVKDELTAVKDELTAVKEDLYLAKESSISMSNKLRYVMADFDNYRKQLERQVDSRIDTNKAELLLKFLNIRDDYLRALEIAKQSKSERAVIEGLVGILKNFDMLLRSEGVTEIETTGTPFDPNVHDAISFSDRSDEPENTVISEIRKGYILNNKVLRPSLVEISRKIVKNNANDKEKIEESES
jgi:molecular chaperone GrpE